MHINPRWAGGRPDAPPQIFREKRKNGGAQCGSFLHTFSYIFFAPFLKVSAQGLARSVHRVRSNDPTSKNICDCAMTTVLKGSTRNFQELIRTSVPTKRISRNLDYSDLGSDQFSGRTIIRQWENVQMLLIPKARGR